MSHKSSPPQDLQLAATLAGLDDETLIDVSALAALMCLTPASARQAAYRNPSVFPPRFPTPSRHLRWRLGDVRQWIRLRATVQRESPSQCDSAGAPTQNSSIELDRGEPPRRATKAERVRLQRLGDQLRRGGHLDV